MINCSNKYDDIINLPHPTSSKHPPMDIAARAAQFSPFAALTGYEAALQETARLTEARIELDEDRKRELDERLREMQEQSEGRDNHGKWVITYFQPDERKPGGAYLTVTGRVKRIDPYEGLVIMQDSERIVIKDIVAIENAPTNG